MMELKSEESQWSCEAITFPILNTFVTAVQHYFKKLSENITRNTWLLFLDYL